MGERRENFIMFTHLKVFGVAGQSQCFIEGFHVTEFQENLLNFKKIYSQILHQFLIDSQQNKNMLFKYIYIYIFFSLIFLNPSLTKFNQNFF